MLSNYALNQRSSCLEKHPLFCKELARHSYSKGTVQVKGRYWMNLMLLIYSKGYQVITNPYGRDHNRSLNKATAREKKKE